MSKYLLKNKDKIVLEFEVEETAQSKNDVKIIKESITNIQIHNKSLLPISLEADNLAESLESFIKHRKAPNHRQYIQKIIASYANGKEKLMDYVNVSLALSLNDSLWIVPNDKNYQWKEYNLYENPFNKTLQLVAFGLKTSKISAFISSPEFTTNGMLKKCWHIDSNQIYLYKGSSVKSDNEKYGGKETYSEYYMAQIAQIMEFECVFYDLKLFHNELVSTCPIFTNENEGFMPIYIFLNPKDRKLKGLDLVNKLEEIYNKNKLYDLFLFDALICNIDRHLGNFGMMIDNNTNEILRPAPIFDNGYSMFNSLYKDDLENIENVLSHLDSALDFTFDEQLKLFVQERHKENLEKLTDFTFKRHSQFNLSEEWLIPIENCIRTRAKRALEFLKEKNNQTTQETQNLAELNKKLDSSLQRQKARTTQQDKNVSSLQKNKTQTLSEKHKKRHR